MMKSFVEFPIAPYLCLQLLAFVNNDVCFYNV